MALPLPSSLTPSKVASFTQCGLAFRLSAIDRLPEPPSPHAAKGTLVHLALQRLFWEEEPGNRSEAGAIERLYAAVPEILDGEEYVGLELSGDERQAFVDDSVDLVRNYFLLEDPNTVTVIGTEIKLDVTLGSLRLRGIIDRLELDADGELVVTDYKTGKAPGERYEQSKLGGVHFYAFLCEQVLGRRPSRVQLLYLRDPIAISTIPSEQSIRALRQRTQAIWTAVEKACEREDFRPKTSGLCDYCAYKAYCPAFGGSTSVLAEQGDLIPA